MRQRLVRHQRQGLDLSKRLSWRLGMPKRHFVLALRSSSPGAPVHHPLATTPGPWLMGRA